MYTYYESTANIVHDFCYDTSKLTVITGVPISIPYKSYYLRVVPITSR